MEKIKTSELKGVALDWAVAKCEGYDMSKAVCFNDRTGVYGLEKDKMLRYSTDWAQGGPIIEREYIDLNRNDAGTWYASTIINYAIVDRDGSTPLIAAMRCYVASKLGNEVEVPDELIGE